MRVTIEYLGQLRDAAGSARQELEVEPGASVGEVLRLLGSQGTATLRDHLFSADGVVRPSLMMFRGSQQAFADEALGEGETLLLGSPISGG